MSLKLVIGVGVFFILMSLTFGFVLAGPGPLASNTQIASRTGSGATTVRGDNAIARENAQLGTRKWEIPASRQASTQIQAYASATSVMAGEKLTFFVSTAQNGDRFSV